MGLFDSMFGRSRPVRPDLDRLFALPPAALTLQAATALTPTGVGSVGFKLAEGLAFSQITDEARRLVALDDPSAIETSTDSYGYAWVVLRGDPLDLSGLVTNLHAVNATIEGQGFGSMLLATVIGFAAADGRRLSLVYRYKSGTWFPFAPQPGHRRDNLLELQVKHVVERELPIEPDPSLWFALWDAPGT